MVVWTSSPGSRKSDRSSISEKGDFRMRAFKLFLVVPVLFVLVSPASAQVDEATETMVDKQLAGDWYGTLKVGELTYKVKVTFKAPVMTMMIATKKVEYVYQVKAKDTIALALVGNENQEKRVTKFEVDKEKKTLTLSDKKGKQVFTRKSPEGNG